MKILACLSVLAFAGGASAQESAEERIRRQMLEEMTKRVQDGEKLVTLDLKDATIEQVLDEFRKQTGISIDLDPRNLPEEFRVKVFKVTKVPFREAFDAFLAKADLLVAEETATLIRLVRPARVSFNFPQAHLVSVIDMIARLSNANIIIAPDIMKIKDLPVSVTVHDVPWNEVLNALVKSAGFLAVREKYDIIRIIDPKELLKQMEVRAYPLKHIQPPPTYRPKVQEGTLISGKPLQPQQQLDMRLKEFVLQKVLETVLTRDAANKLVGNLNFDWGTNTFFVRDTKPTLDRIEEMIKLIDVEPEQVLIDLKVVSTTNEDLLNFGMNYAIGTTEGLTVATRPLHPLSYTGTPTSTGAPVTNTTVFEGPFTQAFAGRVTQLPFGAGHEIQGSTSFLTEYQMVATMRAFRRDRFSKLIQQPTLAVLDNQEATIFVGEEIRYAEISTELTQFGTPVNSIKEAKNSPVKIGFQLYVLPKVIPASNKVILTLIPQNEVLSGTSSPLVGFERFSMQLAGANAFIDLPRVASTTVVTKIVLESGRTAVLGGLVSERSTYEDKGIPLLMDIPILSYLFKQRNDTIRKEHLLIFITPRIVRAGRGSAEALEAQAKVREESIRRELDDFKRQRSREELERQEAERRKAEAEKFEKELKTPK